MVDDTPNSKLSSVQQTMQKRPKTSRQNKTKKKRRLKEKQKRKLKIMRVGGEIMRMKQKQEKRKKGERKSE